MATLNLRSATAQMATIVMKDAPERVLDQCIKMEHQDGSRVKLTDLIRENLNKTICD